jgi:hypothetical protein
MLSGASLDRRRLLQFLAASPVLAAAGAWGQQAAPGMAAADEAISLLDFEEAARRALPTAHWGYMASGVDDDVTLKANREGFRHFQLRPRRLVDVSRVDTRTEVFGTMWEAPIFLCPVGGQKMFHREGEVAVARAAAAKKTLQILSTASSSPVEEVAKALGAARGTSCTCLHAGTASSGWCGASRRRDARCSCGRSICSADATWRPRSDPAAATRATARHVTRRLGAAAPWRSFRC